MKLSGSRNKRKKARIEIIPLIDIMFFLLATFALISFSMTENKGLSVNLPSSKTSTDAGSSTKENENKVITISILESGKYALDKNELGIDQIKEQLSKLNLTGKEKVLIQGDKGSKLQDTINILDLTKELKLESVTLRTKTSN